MKPLIGFSILLVMLVGSIDIIKFTHSFSHNDQSSRVKRYQQQPSDIGMPGPAGETNQNEPTTGSQAAKFSTDVPEQPEDMYQNNQELTPPVNNPQQSNAQPANPVDKSEPWSPPGGSLLELRNDVIPKDDFPTPTESSGRNLANIINNSEQIILGNRQQQSQQPVQQQQPEIQQQPPPPSPHEQPQDDKQPPRIIENNREIVPPRPIDTIHDASNQQIPQAQQTPLPQQTGAVMTNQTMASSTARGYGLDGWTHCAGTESGKAGVCKNDVDCRNAKGRPEGSCMGGLGVCCVIALSCGDKSTENNTFFANPDFPDGSWEARLCEVEIKKQSSSIAQILIEFEQFELALPDHEGECVIDIFQVKLASNRYSPYTNVRLCGMNTGQHLYLDVSQLEDPIVLSVATSGSGYARRWSIKIIQMDNKNFLQAPPGCLQYYTDTTGIIRSFNLGKNLRSLYYTICFRIDNGYSGIRFTDNFFGMSGGDCTSHPRPAIAHGGHRKRPAAPVHHTVTYSGQQTIAPIYQQQGQPQPQPQQPGYYGNVYNPNHLVIAPPGHVPQLPPPGYAPTQAGVRRYKRQGYGSNYTLSTLSRRDRRQVGLDVNGQPMKREHFWQQNSKQHEKEENKEIKVASHEEYYPTTYQPGYPSSYPAASEYAGSHHLNHDGKHHQQHPEHHHYQQQQHYQPGYYGPTPYPQQSPTNYGPAPQGRYGSTGQQYGSQPSSGYAHSGYDGVHGGPPHHKAGHHGGHMKHQPHPGGYGGGMSYGHNSAQYPYAWPNGGAYHEEIDKFGKKYEEIYYQNEQNHKKGDKKESDKKDDNKKDKKDKDRHHEVIFPELELFEPPHCEPRSCSTSDVITFPPSAGSTAEMCGNQFNRGRGSIVVSGSPLVVYVNSRGRSRGFGFDLYYEQVFALPHHRY